MNAWKSLHFITNTFEHFYKKNTWRWHHEFYSNHSKTWSKIWRKAPERKKTIKAKTMRANKKKKKYTWGFEETSQCKADIDRERLLPILCIEIVLKPKNLNNEFLISGPIVNSVGGGEETHTLKRKKLDTGNCWYLISLTYVLLYLISTVYDIIFCWQGYLFNSGTLAAKHLVDQYDNIWKKPARLTQPHCQQDIQLPLTGNRILQEISWIGIRNCWKKENWILKVLNNGLNLEIETW